MERFTDICTQVENDLALFVGGELEAPTHAALQRHLETCAACEAKARAAHAAHAALSRGLTQAAGSRTAAAAGAERAPMVDLWPGIRAQLGREGRLAPVPAKLATHAAPIEPAAPRSALPQRPNSRVHARYAAAAAILLAALGWWSFGRDSADGVRSVPIVDATPVNGGRAPVSPAPKHPHPELTPVGHPAPGDALAQGLQRVPLNVPSLGETALPVDADSEIRSPIFYGTRALEGSPAGVRLVPQRR